MQLLTRGRILQAIAVAGLVLLVAPAANALTGPKQAAVPELPRPD